MATYSSSPPSDHDWSSLVVHTHTLTLWIYRHTQVHRLKSIWYPCPDPRPLTPPPAQTLGLYKGWSPPAVSSPTWKFASKHVHKCTRTQRIEGKVTQKIRRGFNCRTDGRDQVQTLDRQGYWSASCLCVTGHVCSPFSSSSHTCSSLKYLDPPVFLPLSLPVNIP